MKKSIFILALCIFFTTSCEDMLEVEPTNAVDLEVAINFYTGLRGLLIDVYDDFQSTGLFGSALTLLPEIMADNCDFLMVQGYYRSHFFNQFDVHMNAWIYETINQLNLIIANAGRVQDDPGVTEAEFKSMVGQAYALRALAYFYMVNVYAYAPSAVVADHDRGGVPLMLIPVMALEDIEPLPRAPVQSVYDLIRDDLDQAIDLLGNDDAMADGKAFFSQAAVQAFLSRVALFEGDWPAALEAATDAIDSGIATLSSRESYLSDWAAPVHRESFFTLIYDATDAIGSFLSPKYLYNSTDSRYPDFQGHGEYVPAQAYLDLLAENDVRRQALQMGNHGRLETIKFTNDNGVAFVGNIVLIRLSEIFLNRAEAYARLNREQEAIADLDLLRARSLGPGFTPTTASGEDLLDAIFLERRLELAFEGLRWFDLKRLGMDVDKSQITGEVIDFQTDARILAPIPQQEMDLNPNMVQNAGY